MSKMWEEILERYEKERAQRVSDFQLVYPFMKQKVQDEWLEFVRRGFATPDSAKVVGAVFCAIVGFQRFNSWREAQRVLKHLSIQEEKDVVALVAYFHPQGEGIKEFSHVK